MFLFRTASGWILAAVALLMVPVGFLHALYIADEETLLQVSAYDQCSKGIYAYKYKDISM